MNPQDFAQKIKAKYPSYQNVDDLDLARRIVQKYPQYSSQVDFSLATPTRRRGFISETLGDIRETGTAIKEDIGRRLEKTQEAETARQKGEQGLLRTLFQRFGQGAGAVSDVAGQAILGIGKAILPQRAEEAVARTFQAGAERVVELEPVQKLLTNFAQLKKTNPALARDIDSALGISTLGLDVATLGVGGRATNIAARGVSRAAEGTGRAVGATARGTRRIGFELEGALTGTSQETLEEAFQAARRGGKQFDDFTSNLRGRVTPEELVENVRGATNEIAIRRSVAFREAFEPIVTESVDATGIRQSVLSKLREFGVKEADEGLDFSNSKFRRTPQAQSKLNQMYEEIIGLDGPRTLGEIDTTRQVLRELRLTGDDASARSANALIDQATNSVREAGKKVKGYGELLKRFAEDSEFLTELQRSLSTGDQATIDTAYRKLATSLKTNNERRMNLLRELDNATGGALLGSIAGQQLSEALPRGLFRQIAAGMAGVGVATGTVAPSFLVSMVFASPRVVGETIRILGLSTRKADIVIDTINQARKTLEKISVPVPLASPVLEGIEGNLETQ